MRKNVRNRTKPSLNDLCINAERQDIYSRQFIALSPVRRSVGIDVCPGEALQAKMVWLPEKILSEQLLYEKAAAKAVRRRAHHRDQVRIPLSGRKHLLCLREIHRHARLREHMFAGFKRRDGDC